MAERSGFEGGLTRDAVRPGDAKRPVRNDVARPRAEVAALRHWKIHKGSYPEFRRASEEAIWPFFEKLGARIVGMWKVVPPPGEAEPPDFDEVYLLTRYASIGHWKATRDMARLGGNGPDFEKCRKAVLLRQSLSLETSVRFLEGALTEGGPYYLPGLDESYVEAGPAES